MKTVIFLFYSKTITKWSEFSKFYVDDNEVPEIEKLIVL